MEQLQNNPVVKFANARPRLSAWVVLSVGMVVLLVIEGRDVGLLVGQWVSLIVATVLVAGACVWIISWEDADETDEALTTSDMPKVEAKADEGESA
ncbi:MAG: hypothetical protein AAF125_07410 [Chloroflexota bacterium]